MIGQQSAEAVQGMIQNASNEPKTGMIATVVGVFTLILGGRFGGAEIIAHVVDLLFSFLLTTALSAMIYEYLPDVRIQWRDVWIGVALTAALFTIGKFLIGLYLGRSGVSSAYGAAGSLITVLSWVYYSSLIFFLGAEFTQVYASIYGSGVTPAQHTEPISAQKRETPPPERRTRNNRELRAPANRDKRTSSREAGSQRR